MRRWGEDWLTVTGPLVFCIAEDCDFAYHGDKDLTASKAIRRATHHRDTTDHEVRIERGQVMILAGKS